MAVWWRMGRGPVQKAWALESLCRVQMDWAQSWGKFKEAQYGSDLHLKGQSGQRLVGTALAGEEPGDYI